MGVNGKDYVEIVTDKSEIEVLLNFTDKGGLGEGDVVEDVEQGLGVVCEDGRVESVDEGFDLFGERFHPSRLQDVGLVAKHYQH